MGCRGGPAWPGRLGSLSCGGTYQAELVFVGLEARHVEHVDRAVGVGCDPGKDVFVFCVWRGYHGPCYVEVTPEGVGIARAILGNNTSTASSTWAKLRSGSQSL